MISTTPGGEPQPEQEGREWSLGRSITRNPVLHTLVFMTVISLFSWSVIPGRIPETFVASPPIGEPWYELLLANYSHLNSAHLFSNALIIAIAGGIISISSSMLRFHAFFIITGVTSIVAQVVFSSNLRIPAICAGIKWCGICVNWILDNFKSSFDISVEDHQHARSCNTTVIRGWDSDYSV